MSNVLISVIVPVFNIMKYLPRCVASIQNQTYKNIEIVLIDDGSTDGSSELCDELAAKDARISVYHKENGGASSARNFGIKKARGVYLGFVDSDDYIEPTMYEILIRAMEQEGCQIVQIGRDEVNEDGSYREAICVAPSHPEIINSEKFLTELLMHRGDCSFCTKLIGKELFEINTFPEGVLNEDFRLLIQFLIHVQGVVSLPSICYHVCYRVGSNTRKEDKSQFSTVFYDSVVNSDFANKVVHKYFNKNQQLIEISERFQMYQRVEYLLHIPIVKMVKANVDYYRICKFMRKNWWKAMKNQYLTLKNKIYISLFAFAPKQIRKLHYLWKGEKLK